MFFIVVVKILFLLPSTDTPLTTAAGYYGLLTAHSVCNMEISPINTLQHVSRIFPAPPKYCQFACMHGGCIGVSVRLV